jgi:hypothetical protein
VTYCLAAACSSVHQFRHAERGSSFRRRARSFCPPSTRNSWDSFYWVALLPAQPVLRDRKEPLLRSHCTAPRSSTDPKSELPYCPPLRPHQQGSCAISVLESGDPVRWSATIRESRKLDSMPAGRASHPIPPAAGCTTNVEKNDRPRRRLHGAGTITTCSLRRLRTQVRLFALLHRMEMSTPLQRTPGHYDAQSAAVGICRMLVPVCCPRRTPAGRGRIGADRVHIGGCGGAYSSPNG